MCITITSLIIVMTSKQITLTIIINIDINNGIGFCYWGAELIAWDGINSENGSVWENQALFDFDNKELPTLQEFNLN